GTWRHFSEVDLDASNPAPINASFDAQDYFDLSSSYQLLDNTRIRFGVNNVTDEDPPLSSVVGTAPGNGNTYPQVYDALGRYIFMGATVDF
ncbi:MAG: TonB-dependent receptor, partial [Henriciella sp.]|nr:TonB-dependent receptor [Henriciella sp.]